MDDQYFGTKQLYEVALKATDNMRIGARQIEKGEPVTYFDNIQIASLSERITPVYAKGGKGNNTLVVWEQRNSVDFSMTCGVLSNIGLALLTNATAIPSRANPIPISITETIELDYNGKGVLTKQQIALDKPYFCFVYQSGIIQNKIIPKSITPNGELDFGPDMGMRQVLVDYYFYYHKDREVFVLQKERFNGMFELSGKFYRKGQDDGINRTSVFVMPKVRILSNLNIQLGAMASPAISNFNIIATPYKTPYSDYSVMEIYNLDEDIS